MTIAKHIFGNYLLVSAISGWLMAQILKVFTGMFHEKKFNIFHLLFSNGGMPSSHAATVMALSTAAAMKFGFLSAEFAIATVLAIIVMNDAAGVRYETGEQAKILNRITKELFSGDQEKFDTGLKELVGHTPFQVFMGALVGVLVGIALAFAMKVPIVL